MSVGRDGGRRQPFKVKHVQLRELVLDPRYGLEVLDCRCPVTAAGQSGGPTAEEGQDALDFRLSALGEKAPGEGLFG